MLKDSRNILTDSSIRTLLNQSFVNWLARAEWNLLNVTFFGGERIDESNLLRKKLYSEFI